MPGPPAQFGSVEPAQPISSAGAGLVMGSRLRGGPGGYILSYALFRGFPAGPLAPAARAAIRTNQQEDGSDGKLLVR